MSRQPYAFIFVHRDVLTTARAVVNQAEISMVEAGIVAFDSEDIRALRDLVDPLPEPDIYGRTPGIQEIELPALKEPT